MRYRQRIVCPERSEARRHRPVVGQGRHDHASEGHFGLQQHSSRQGVFEAEDEEWATTPDWHCSSDAALNQLRSVPGFDGFCLLDGAALAVHRGPRLSLDMALFSLMPDGALESSRRALFAHVPDCCVVV